jgi:hypothetical protein
MPLLVLVVVIPGSRILCLRHLVATVARIGFVGVAAMVVLRIVVPIVAVRGRCVVVEIGHLEC